MSNGSKLSRWDDCVSHAVHESFSWASTTSTYDVVALSYTPHLNLNKIVLTQRLFFIPSGIVVYHCLFDYWSSYQEKPPRLKDLQWKVLRHPAAIPLCKLPRILEHEKKMSRRGSITPKSHRPPLPPPKIHWRAATCTPGNELTRAFRYDLA